MNKIFIFLALLTLILSQDDLFNLVILSQDRGAACLDGSPSSVLSFVIAWRYGNILSQIMPLNGKA